jgi:lipid II:glycine glycyltransferase (peptidoglycan interpeptide bridge formation enzyme)
VQRNNYSRRLKTQVNKAQRLCTIIAGETGAHVQNFIEIYHDNMQRVDADESYFFEDDYFYNLLASPDFETELSLAICNETNEVMAGALFIKTNSIVQYHLSGIREEFLHINPIKLIIDEMRKKSTNEGYTYLNLGGGRSNKQDSLFNFKLSFSKHLKPFKLWKYICNEQAYEDLVILQKQLDKKVSSVSNEEFFPAYRRVLTR